MDELLVRHARKEGMMRSLKYLVTAFIISTAVSTCMVSADVIGETDKEVEAVAEPILDGILKGVKYGRYWVVSDEAIKWYRENRWPVGRPPNN